MNIKSIKLACFSPTGTTKTVISGIARGIDQSNVELIDITLPESRNRKLEAAEDDLLIVGIPVYIGRVPALVNGWLNSIKANNTPTVCVVVYGNRAYENALLELKDILTSRGCVLLAAGAYIAEHSFSNSEMPIAEGRPDANDLEHAEMFGRKINEKLLAISSADDISDVEIPGEKPYGGETKLWDVDFIAVSDDCIQCGICADGCPVAAIDHDDSREIDIKKCITCCACIKSCPENARTMKDSEVKKVAVHLFTLFQKRQEPVFFL